MTSVVDDSTPTADGADEADGDAPIMPRSRWENILGVLILLEAAHVLYYWYPMFGFIADNRLTNVGRLIWPCLAGASMCGIIRRPWLERRSLDPLVAIPVLLISVSFFWSVDTFRTLYQSIVLVAALACGSYLSIAYRRRELVTLVSNTLGIACAISVVAALAGISNRAGQTTGFFEHKNILGPVAAIGMIFFVARFASGNRHRLVQLGMLFCGVALFMSGSRTSQFSTLIVLMAVVFVALKRQNQSAALAVATPMVALFAVALRAAGGLSAIFVASGKSSDLTGRTEIWATVASIVQERPVAGWGYLAYWRDEGFANGARSGFEEFGLRSAHNGYLETALGAGLVAGTLVAVGLLHLAIRGYRRSARQSPQSHDIALACMALFCLAANMSESIFPASTVALATVTIVALSAAPRMRERAR